MPALLDDPDYHADVKRGVVPLAHAVGTDGASLRLALGSGPPLPRRRKKHPAAVASDSENTDASDAE